MPALAEMQRYTDSQTWYVVFTPCLGNHWWKYLLHPKFQHVHMIRENRGDCLMVNSFAHCMAVREYPNSVFDIIQQELTQSPTAILQFTVHYGSHYRPFPMEIHSCVTVCKRLLGLRNRILTPKSLYHEMILAGAMVVKPYCVL